MADAKQCDRCKELYPEDSDENMSKHGILKK